MAKDEFLPTPEVIPPVPQGIERSDGRPASLDPDNQRIGCGMLGRPEGTTLTELKRCCEQHHDYYYITRMPDQTAKLTVYKLKNHWRWSATKQACRAVRTGGIRGGEPVYRLV